MIKDVLKYLQPNAVIPIDMETTIMLVNALKEALAQPEQEPVAWLLTDKNINEIQVDSIQRLINRLKHAHQTDLCVRINGQYEWFQADWLKHMVRAAPPQSTEPLPQKKVWTFWDLSGGDITDAIKAKLKEKNT